MKYNRWLLGLGLCLTGCASRMEVFAPDQAPEYMVARTTPFYKNGPSQPGRPDQLPPETFVQLKARDAAYSVVALPDGRSGYVATEDLRPAPPTGRAVAGAELFPEKYADFAAVNLPEPDLTLPVEDIAGGSGQ